MQALPILIVLALLSAFDQTLTSTAETAPYTIDAIRYASVRDFALSGLVMGAPKEAKTDIAMVFWLIRGQNRVILFDSGFHRARWMTQFKVEDFLAPDAAVRLAGVEPTAVTDIIVSRHTFASQYIRVAGERAFVLASDNCYLYENLKSRRASATFDKADEPGNIATQQRMIDLAGDAARVIPGHDPEQFRRYSAEGRVARIK